MAAEDIGQIPDKKDGDLHYPSEFNIFKAAIEAAATLVQLQEVAGQVAGKASIEQVNAKIEPAATKADVATDKSNQNAALLAKIQLGEVILSPYHTKEQAGNLFQEKGASTSWNAISGKPQFFDGNYNSLTNRPEQFSGNYQDLTNKPALFNGSYESLTNKPEPMDLTDLATKEELEAKVDHVEGMFLTPNPFTNSYKKKVDQIEDPKYKGRFKSVAQLKAAHSGTPGANAFVEIMVNDVLTIQNYIYDAVADDWTLSVATGTEESPLSVRQKLEANDGVQIYMDADADKLAGIATGATKNSSDADLKNRKNHTGTSGLSSIEYLTDILNGMNTTNDQQNMAISGHAATTSNPHKVTKAQVGLSDADNTSDKNKPASDAVLNLLSGKEPANSNIQDHISKRNNPHGVTKEQIGLGKADDTADVDKPASKATLLLLVGKENSFVKGSIKKGSGVSITGNLDKRLVGDGDITISADAGDPMAAYRQTPTYFHDYVVAPVNTLGFGYTGQTGATSTFTNNYILRSGVMTMTKGATANTGVCSFLHNAVNTIVISGGEEYVMCFRALQLAAASTMIRCGFLDHTIPTGVPKNGIYFDYDSVQKTFTAKTMKAGVISAMPLGNNYAPNNWYTLRIVVNVAANSVLFQIYNESGVLMNSTSITTSIPAGDTATNTIYSLGVGMFSWGAGAPGGAICNLDYQLIKMGNYPNR